mgnify:CR=1 FL=1
MHGMPSIIKHDGDGLFAGVSEEFTAGRYHSLVAKTVPDCLHVCARTEDHKVMAISHKTKPISALQFHPESIMSLEGQAGHRMIANVLSVSTLTAEDVMIPRVDIVAIDISASPEELLALFTEKTFNELISSLLYSFNSLVAFFSDKAFKFFPSSEAI